MFIIPYDCLRAAEWSALLYETNKSKNVKIHIDRKYETD